MDIIKSFQDKEKVRLQNDIEAANKESLKTKIKNKFMFKKKIEHYNNKTGIDDYIDQFWLINCPEE